MAPEKLDVEKESLVANEKILVDEEELEHLEQNVF